MATSKKSKNFALRVELRSKLEDKWQKMREKDAKVPDQFGTYVNDLLEDIIRKDEFLSVYAPGLHSRGFTDGVLFIEDIKRGTAEIYLHDHTIKCDLCKSFDCEHIHFALALPEVARLNIKNKKRAQSVA